MTAVFMEPPREVEWVLDCRPRDVQKEAILRSFYGFRTDEATGKLHRIHAGIRRGWAHFLEMRLGKTPTAFNEFMLLDKYRDVRQMVVISPNDYKYDWEREAVKFGVPYPFLAHETSRPEYTHRHVESARKRHIGFGLVVNYESLRHDSTKEIIKDIMQHDATLMVFDESIQLKNHEAQSTKSAIEMSKDAAYVRLLSGLFMTQGPHDLYAQMRVIGELDGTNFYGFRNRYCKMGGFKGKQVMGVREDRRADLLALINRNGFVAKREKWGKRGDYSFDIVRLGMTNNQKKLYDQMNQDLIAELESGDVVTADMVITKLNKLQQISSGFLYDEFKNTHVIEQPKKIPKLQRLVRMLDETESKVVVVYNFRPSADILMEALKAFSPAVLRGKADMHAMGLTPEGEKERFNNDRSCRVMIANVRASKYGHDLSGVEGDRCTTMVFYENSYSLDDRTQVEQRNTAAEQDWSNLYFDFVSSEVEMNAIQALQRKESVVNAVVGPYLKDKQEKSRIIDES